MLDLTSAQSKQCECVMWTCDKNHTSDLCPWNEEDQKMVVSLFNQINILENVGTLDGFIIMCQLKRGKTTSEVSSPHEAEHFQTEWS